MKKHHIAMIGLPRTVGGGFTERGATILMWRKMGWEVDCYATLPEHESNPWLKRLDDAGCRVFTDTMDVMSLKDTLCVGMCCFQAVSIWPLLKSNGCQLIWSPCMNTPLRIERTVFPFAPPTMVHFQSEYQAENLRPHYASLGCKRFSTINGAFDVNDFQFQPRNDSRHFVIGKLARPSRTKWPVDLWNTLGDAHDRIGSSMSALCMAWDSVMEARLGKPPAWAECLPQDSITSADFMSRCEVLYCAGQEDIENWPRVGMEAMASGVVVVADDAGGWREMIRNCESGYLANLDEIREILDYLALNPQRRFDVAHNARSRVERLADPEVIGMDWKAAIESLPA